MNQKENTKEGVPLSFTSTESVNFPSFKISLSASISSFPRKMKTKKKSKTTGQMKINEFIQVVDTWMETFESHHLSREQTEESSQGVRLNPKRLFYFICVILSLTL